MHVGDGVGDRVGNGVGAVVVGDGVGAVVVGDGVGAVVVGDGVGIGLFPWRQTLSVSLANAAVHDSNVSPKHTTHAFMS